MGKPYEDELSNLEKTYRWALQEPLNELCTFLAWSHELPMLVVGSGGSFTAANMAALLHRQTGMIAAATTPLDIRSFSGSIRGNSVLLLSANGSNKDILSTFRFVIRHEPQQLGVMCMRRESPLAALASTFIWPHSINFDLPTGKDGFLATNSLFAFSTLLIRANAELNMGQMSLPDNLNSVGQGSTYFGDSIEELLTKNVWIVLYGGWALPAAIDLESKLTEAGLRCTQLADFRNFAHGRHYWLARHPDDTGVIALITPDEIRLAEKTLALIPDSIPSYSIITDRFGPSGALELLTRVMSLVSSVAKAQGVDPGMPSVPTFGRKIYHLGIVTAQDQKAPINKKGTAAILRKSGFSSIENMRKGDIEYWTGAYNNFITRIGSTTFGAVALDYDGTLCDRRGRYEGLIPEIGKELIRILKGGIVVGIATGRGQSVRIALQVVIPKKYWEQVVIGYYNGSEIALLMDDSTPRKTTHLDPCLAIVKATLDDSAIFRDIATYQCRPTQLTIEPNKDILWTKCKRVIFDIVQKVDLSGVRVLESSHSIDVIAPNISKVNLVEACRRVAEGQGNPTQVLCIGDKGAWPGNDYDLLSTEYSLSVDTISPDPSSCWNLSRVGERGVRATIGYLERMSVGRRGTITFSVGNST